MRSSCSPPYFEIIQRIFRFGLSADRLPGNISHRKLACQLGFCTRGPRVACISALQGTGAKHLVSEIVRTDLEKLIRCRGKSFYSVECVFRGRVFYLRQDKGITGTAITAFHYLLASAVNATV